MRNLRTILIAVLLLTMTSTEAHGQLFRNLRRPSGTVQRRTSGRDCSSPYCLMCALNYGPMPGYAIRGNRIVRVGSGVRSPSKPDPMAAALASTPQPIVDVMLLIAHQYGRLTEDDVLLDPGCGDGRFLIKAVKRFGCKAIGVEIDPKTADLAEAAIKEAGVGKQVLVVRGDATKHQLGIATAVTLYLFPDTIRAVMSKLDKENVRVVVSHQHPIPGVTNRSMEFSVDGETHTIFFWSREE